MLDSILISRKEIGKLKVGLKNPLGLTCEKIAQTPRVFTTSQIKNAIENILIVCNIDENIPKLLLRTTEYVLKDLFLYMHQTGLYNRQFNLWSTLGHIRRISIFRMEKKFFKNRELYCYVFDLFIDEKIPCVKVVIQAVDNNKNNYIDFKTYLSWAIRFSKLKRLKGVIYFIKKDVVEPRFLEKLDILTNAFDPISKYESIINKTNDLRLNVIAYKEKGSEDENYNFEHIYPEVRTITREDLRVRN